MAKTMQPIVTLADLELEPFQHGNHYQSLDAGISELMGLTQLGAVLTEVPPGKSACPFHVHHVEDELFFVLAGAGEYRFGAETFTVKAGDALGAPRGGPAFAHKLTNTGSEPLRYLAISSKADTELCEYPDSGKFMVRSQGEAGRDAEFDFVGRREDAKDYWDGEP